MNLYEHQKEGVAFARSMGANVALFWDMGTGKTITTLKIFEALKTKYPEYRLIVACPLTLINNAWRDDTYKFTNFSFCNLRDGYKEADVYAFNYEMLFNKFTFIKKVFDKVLFVLDESSRIKNNRSQTYKHIKKLGALAKYRLVLSGTPCPNSEDELWTQIDFIRPGLLGESFYSFRNRNFQLTRGKESIPCSHRMGELLRKGYKMEIVPQARERLTQVIAPYTSWKRIDECVDLPEEVDEFIKLDMSTRQAPIYESMAKKAIAEIDETTVLTQVVLTKLMKLRQITSGFIIDEDENVHDIDVISPKMAALKDALEGIGKEQAIIWVNFIHEVHRLKEMLGLQAGFLYSGTPNKDQVIQDFKEGKLKYLVANPQSAAHGLTFTNCRYQIFFSLSYSYEQYAQARARTRRISQKGTCVYIHLLMKGTIDEVILQVVQCKGDKIQIIEDYIKDVRKSITNKSKTAHKKTIAGRHSHQTV